MLSAQQEKQYKTFSKDFGKIGLRIKFSLPASQANALTTSYNKLFSSSVFVFKEEPELFLLAETNSRNDLALSSDCHNEI